MHFYKLQALIGACEPIAVLILHNERPLFQLLSLSFPCQRALRGLNSYMIEVRFIYILLVSKFSQLRKVC